MRAVIRLRPDRPRPPDAPSDAPGPRARAHPRPPATVGFEALGLRRGLRRREGWRPPAGACGLTARGRAARSAHGSRRSRSGGPPCGGLRAAGQRVRRQRMGVAAVARSVAARCSVRRPRPAHAAWADAAVAPPARAAVGAPPRARRAGSDVDAAGRHLALEHLARAQQPRERLVGRLDRGGRDPSARASAASIAARRPRARCSATRARASAIARLPLRAAGALVGLAATALGDLARSRSASDLALELDRQLSLLGRAADVPSRRHPAARPAAARPRRTAPPAGGHAAFLGGRERTRPARRPPRRGTRPARRRVTRPAQRRDQRLDLRPRTRPRAGSCARSGARARATAVEPLGSYSATTTRARRQERDRHRAEAARDVGLDQRRRLVVDGERSRSTWSR